MFSYRNYLWGFFALVVLLIVLAGCGNPVTPTPKVGVLKTDAQVRRQAPVVWAGESSPLPRLLDGDWHDLNAGGQVTTDAAGEAWLDISDCLRIYLFQSSQLVKAACPKSSYSSGNVTCALSGTGVYNNACSSQVVLQTLSADVVLQGTWVMLTYVPEKQLTVVVVAEGEADVWPVTEFDARETADRPITVRSQEVIFTAPDDMLEEIAGLPPRQALPLAEVYPLVDELDLWPWLDEVIERADTDDVPFPSREEAEEAFIVRGAGGELTDPELAKALSYAVDWSTILQEMFPDAAPSVRLRFPNVEYRSDELGFDLAPLKGWLEDNDYEQGFEIAVLAAAESGDVPGAAEWMTSYLTGAGLQPDLQVIPRREALKVARSYLNRDIPVLWVGAPTDEFEDLSEAPSTSRRPTATPTRRPTHTPTPDQRRFQEPFVVQGAAGPLEDARVDQAVAQAVVWKDLLAELFPDYKSEITLYLPSLTISSRKAPYDPDKAIELLYEADYPDGFDVVIVAEDRDAFMAAAEWMAAQLEEIGIHPELTSSDRRQAPDLLREIANEGISVLWLGSELDLSWRENVSAPAPETVARIQVDVLSSSDWTSVYLSDVSWYDGGEIVESETIETTGEMDFAYMEDNGLFMAQDLGRAETGYEMGMSQQIGYAELPSGDPILVRLEKGCIGYSEVAVYNLQSGTPKLLGRLSAEGCDENFVLPIARKQLLSFNPAAPDTTPLNISVSTSSDWTTIAMPDEALITERRTLGVDGDVTYAMFGDGAIQIGQDLNNAQEGATIDMTQGFVFTDWPEEEDMTITVNRGCLGETTITFFNPDIQAFVGQFSTDECENDMTYTFNPNTPQPISTIMLLESP